MPICPLARLPLSHIDPDCSAHSVCGNLLEQPSSSFTGCAAREWWNPVGQFGSSVLAFARTLCHRLDGREYQCTSPRCALRSSAPFCGHRVLHLDQEPCSSSRKGLAARDLNRQRSKGRYERRRIHDRRSTGLFSAIDCLCLLCACGRDVAIAGPSYRKTHSHMTIGCAGPSDL